MQELKTEELKEINGGFLGISLGTVALVSLGVPFVSGFLDGITRPLACNDWR